MSDDDLFALDELNDSDTEDLNLESLDSDNSCIRNLLKQAGVVATPNDSEDEDADLLRKKRRTIPTIASVDAPMATPAPAPISTQIDLQPLDFNTTSHHHVTLEPLDIPPTVLQDAPQLQAHAHPGSLSPLAPLHDTHVLPPLPDIYPTAQASSILEGTSAYNVGGDEDGQDYSRRWASLLQMAPANAKGLLKDVQDAMARNLRLQTVMRDQLAVINSTIEANERLRKRVVRVIISQRSYARTSERRHGFKYPYFKDAEGKCPPPNADAIQRRLNAERRPFTFRYRPWLPKEIQALKDEICKQNRDMQVKPLLTEVERLISARLATNDTSLRPRIELLLREVDSLRNEPLDNFAYSLRGINWVTLPKTRPELRKRTPEECRIQWTNVSHPIVNTGPWTKEEDVKILEMARTLQQVDWAVIAETLQTNRTPAACFKRYQMSLNPALLKREWTEEEDQQLKEAVMEYGMGNWNEMRAALPGRTGQQLLHRWKAIDPTIKKGRWTAEEDDLLMAAVARHGLPNWRSISAHVPNRTDAQCRERYNNVLNPSLNIRPWTEEEDATLVRSIEECTTENGISWSLVAAQMETRTDNQCWRRWRQICKSEAAHYRQNWVPRKQALPRARRKSHHVQLTAVDVSDAVVKTITTSQRPAIEAKTSRRAPPVGGGRINRLRAEITDTEMGEEGSENAASDQPMEDEDFGDVQEAGKMMVQRLGGHMHTVTHRVSSAPLVPPLPPGHNSLLAFERIQRDLEEYGGKGGNGQDGEDNGEQADPQCQSPPFHLPSNCDPKARRLYDHMHSLFRWPNYLANNHPPTVIMTQIGVNGLQTTGSNSQTLLQRMPISRPPITGFMLIGPKNSSGRGRRKKVAESEESAAGAPVTVTESDWSVPNMEGGDGVGVNANGVSSSASEWTPKVKRQPKKRGGGRDTVVRSKKSTNERRKKGVGTVMPGWEGVKTQQENGICESRNVEKSSANGSIRGGGGEEGIGGAEEEEGREDSAVLEEEGGVGVSVRGRKRGRPQQGGKVEKKGRALARISNGKAKTSE